MVQDDAETGFAFALVLAVFTSMAMVGLYSVQRALQALWGKTIRTRALAEAGVGCEAGVGG